MPAVKKIIFLFFKEKYNTKPSPMTHSSPVLSPVPPPSDVPLDGPMPCIGILRQVPLVLAVKFLAILQVRTEVGPLPPGTGPHPPTITPRDPLLSPPCPAGVCCPWPVSTLPRVCWPVPNIGPSPPLFPPPATLTQRALLPLRHRLDPPACLRSRPLIPAFSCLRVPPQYHIPRSLA